MRMLLGDRTAAGLMLAGIAVLDALGGGSWRPPAPPTVPLALPSAGQLAVERCRDHVTIIHDVHWAAACMTLAEEQMAAGLFAPDAVDDSPECNLPPQRAESINAERAAAEDRCLAEAVATR